MFATSRRFRQCVAVLLGVTVLYVVSFGPACWWFATSTIPGRPLDQDRGRGWRFAPRIYLPVGWVYIGARECGARPIPEAIRWYSELGGQPVFVPGNYRGDIWELMGGCTYRFPD